MNNKVIDYSDILTDKEIITYALILDKFKKGLISYQKMEKLFLRFNIEIEPIKRKYYGAMITIDKTREIEERSNNNNYISSDLEGIILNSIDYKNVVFRIDYYVIELLAKAGLKKYKKILIGILETQLKLTYNVNQEVANNRRKWKKQIEELKLKI